MTHDRVDVDPVIEAQFRRLVEKHDIGFALSDDPGVYTAGAASMLQIQAVAMLLPRAMAVRIYNEVVDQKFNQGSRRYFYWSTE